MGKFYVISGDDEFSRKQRAREIIGGAQPLIDTKETKPLAIAIEEINRDAISYTRPEEE